MCPHGAGIACCDLAGTFENRSVMQELAGRSHHSIDVRLAPQHPLPMRTIETLHRQKKTGKVSDKWDSYLPIYDRLFGPRKDDAIGLLEIGVQNGGSLEIWS